MTLRVPNASKATLLKAALNHTPPEDQLLKLFTNDKTPADGDVAADYTEAAGGSYAAKALTGSAWSVTTANPAVATYAAQTFTGLTPGNYYGYFIVQASSGLLLWAERFSTSPRVVQAAADEIVFTPRITGDDTV